MGPRRGYVSRPGRGRAAAPVIYQIDDLDEHGEYLMAPSRALTDRIDLRLLDGRPDRRRR
ncbi:MULTISPECIES: hypothetical protein [unclassified Streptomyces]|uniref:hypothetical protein n=1 Tax=unclassified Streptomyces TaxID=2593676 RepID=UPI0033B92676